jgi:hypothetical protein
VLLLTQLDEIKKFQNAFKSSFEAETSSLQTSLGEIENGMVALANSFREILPQLQFINQNLVQNSLRRRSASSLDTMATALETALNQSVRVRTLTATAVALQEALGYPSAPGSTVVSLLQKWKDAHHWKNDQKCVSVEEIVEGVCNTIVGETWYKWDSTSIYLPSLVFLFHEVGTRYAKRSQ